MNLPENITNEFYDITRYDIESYLNEFVEFIRNDRANIFAYYSGKTNSPNLESFNALRNLRIKSDIVNDLIDVNNERMIGYRFWQLIEVLTAIQESLLTIENSSKWLRSIITKDNFTPQVQIQYTLRQFETLEQVALNIGSTDVDSDWITIGLQNNLKEEDYDENGGSTLNLFYKNSLQIKVDSVVDNISGKKIYGIDLDRNISFDNDDLKALSYDDTIKQSVSVLASLTNGQTPEFPLDGMQKDLVGGTNRASIPYPVLFRQLYATFRKDDTLKSFSVKSIENTEDMLKISFEVQTRLAETIPTQTIL